MLAYDFDMLERGETTNQRPAYLVDFIYAFQAQTIQVVGVHRRAVLVLCFIN